MKRLLLICLQLIFFSSIVCTQYQIDFIFESAEGERIEGVSIQVNDDPDLVAFSSDAGQAQLSLPAGNYDINIERLGYLSQSITVDVRADSLISIKLWPQKHLLPFVELTAFSLTGQDDFIGDQGSSNYFISSTALDRVKQPDMHQVLQRVPGVQIQEEEGFGLRPNIGIRGSGSLRSEKILLLEDGIPTAPAPYSAPAAYYSPTFGRMSGLEVKMGSAALIAGPYTTGGAINFLSTPIPNSSSTFARVGLGAFGTQQINLTVGDQMGDFGYVGQFFRQSSDGFKTLPNDGNTGHQKWDGLLKARYLLSAKDGHRHQISFKILHTTESSAETYLGLTEEDFIESPYRRYAASERDEMNTEFTGGHLQYAWIFPDQKSWVTTVYGHQFHRNWYKLDKTSINGEKQSIASILSQPDLFADAYQLITGQSSDGELLLKANNRNYYTYGVQSEFKANWGQQQLRAGIRLHADGIDRFQWVDNYVMRNHSIALLTNGAEGTESNRVENARVASAYTNYGWEWNGFSFTTGARLEYLDLSRDDYGKEDPDRTGSDLSTRTNQVLAIIPGISAQYQINEPLSMYTSVVKGYSPPGNSPDTRPEESINSELGIRYRSDKLQFQLVGFWHEYQRLLGSSLVASGDPTLEEMVNGGSARSTGIEWYGKYQADDHWPIEMSYTYINARFTEDFESNFDPWGNVTRGDLLPYVAPHSLWLQTGYITDLWMISGQLHYQTDFLTTAGSFDDEQLGLGSRWLVSFQVQYQLSKTTSVYARANNLLDQRYAVATRPAGWRPGMPRYWEVGFEYRL